MAGSIVFGKKVEYLAEGDRRTGRRAHPHVSVHEAVVAQATAWMARRPRDKTAPLTWTRSTSLLRCIAVRYGAYGNAASYQHEDHLDDPRTACRLCQNQGVPCVMSTANSAPIVLPLPVERRLPGAKESDEGYFFLPARKGKRKRAEKEL